MQALLVLCWGLRPEKESEVTEPTRLPEQSQSWDGAPLTPSWPFTSAHTGGGGGWKKKFPFGHAFLFLFLFPEGRCVTVEAGNEKRKVVQ